MKYGDTLRQRSIPEWGHFNIDYDDLKDLIKHETTPGAGKSKPIPGQGDSTERAFSDQFYKVLESQHERINLFIKSKSGEIERRLDHISTRLAQLQASRPNDGPGSRLPAKTVEKYAKIDADVTKAGEEIRSLSRFRIAQRTGFYKILKKYKRWTKDRELEHRFKKEYIRNPNSFFQLDLGYLLDQYIDVLGALRAPLDGSVVSSPSNESNPKSSVSQLTKAIEQGSDIDFDVALSTVPLGSQGSKATYWIHPDHIVEVEVLLLQHTRLRTNWTQDNPSPHDSPHATPTRRKSSTTVDRCLGNEEEIGLVLLDNPESFAQRQNAKTVGSNEESKGVLPTQSTGNARWASSGQAAVVVGLETGQVDQNPEQVIVAKLKRKYLEAFLDTSKSFNDERTVSFADGENKQNDASRVRQWLAEHTDMKPMAGICSRRTRFVGLHNSVAGGMWASLDRDIYLSKSLHEHVDSNEWVSEARANSTAFPHAVLEIRREGNQSNGLIQTLDRSHLVERVRGFTIETHAVWICCKPNAMSPPTWLSLLNEDIRKLPAPVKRQRRHAGTTDTTDTQSQSSPPQTSTSVTSANSPYASRNGETSATSISELIEPPPLKAFRKKSKSRKPYSEYPPPIQAETPPNPTQGYWNEYDNPESGDEGYYIYLDPNASVKFPGQELIEAFAHKTKNLFSVGRRRSEESSLLHSPTSYDGGSTDDETADEAHPALKSYGTIPPDPHQTTPPHRSYFSSLFGSLRDPYHDASTLHSIRRHSERQRQSLLSQIELRHRERERAKFLTYVLSLLAAGVIDVILATLVATSRRKLRGEVDVAVILGAIFGLCLLVVALASMKTRQDRLGWVQQGSVYTVVIGMVVYDVWLFRWALNY